MEVDRGRRSLRWEPGKELPLCCIALIAANVLIYLAGLVSPSLRGWMQAKGSFSVLDILTRDEYYRLLTAAFLHVNIEHLVNNMVLLFFCGEIVERCLGHFRFLLLYFLTALAGNLLSAAYELFSGGFYRSMGASGAVFGLTGALLFFVVARKRQAAQIPLPRLIFAIFFSIYAGFRSGGVNNAAHIGGLLGGFLLAFLLSVIPRARKRQNMGGEGARRR